MLSLRDNELRQHACLEVIKKSIYLIRSSWSIKFIITN